MLSVSSPQSPRLTSSAAVASTDSNPPQPGDMDHLLARLRRNMVELILQGDDVTRQMWQMYSVFGEIFGIQKISSKHPVVVGERIKQKAMATSLPPFPLSAAGGKEDNESRLSSTSPTSTTVGAATTATVTTSTTTVAPGNGITTSISGTSTTTIITTTTSTVTATATTATTVITDSSSISVPISIATLPPPAVASPVLSSNDSRQRPLQTDKNPFITNKNNQRSAEDSPPPQMKESPRTPSQTPASSSMSSRTPSNSSPLNVLPRTSNPLLDTIGVLTGSNPDSDDSDLDMVYQQLRYRGKHRRPEQVRMRSHRHHHQQFASSDPESTSYAGSNSIDSGYKSQCATPEVSDSLSAPEVRRSASDVSASDSSTTSGRPRSSDGNESKSSKIKMGTRSMAGKVSPCQTMRISRYQQPPLLESSMNDITLDHLMYLRQSLRKDRQDYFPSSSHSSIPSSSASSTVRDELSPTAITDEENSPVDKTRITQSIPVQQPPPPQQSFIRPVQFTSMDSPPYSGSNGSRNPQGPRSGRRLSTGNEVESHAMASSSSSADYLLSGVEFYDLDSVHDFPQRRGYVAMVEEKTRCSRIHVMAAPKREVPSPDRRPEPSYSKRKDTIRSPPSDQCVYGGYQRRSSDQGTYSAYQRRSSVDSQQPQSHRGANPRAADSKLTEAAIRVLEMIEDFRMEEAIENSSAFDARGRMMSNVAVTTVGPHAFVPRFRRHSGSRPGMRPASTGSLGGVPLDARSVVSAASSYAASAEHHVYEEIMYDLVCERSDQPMPPMVQDHGAKPRTRLLPVRPVTANTAHGYHHPEVARMSARNQKHRSNLYSLVVDHESRNSERFLEMDWNNPRGRRDNMSSDYPA